MMKIPDDVLEAIFKVLIKSAQLLEPVRTLELDGELAFQKV